MILLSNHLTDEFTLAEENHHCVHLSRDEKLGIIDLENRKMHLTNYANLNPLRSKSFPQEGLENTPLFMKYALFHNGGKKRKQKNYP